MQLYFIRHAQSINNALWYQTGSSQGRSEDPAISEIGHRQAERLAQFLAPNSDDQRGVNKQEGSAAPTDNEDLQNRNGIYLTHLYTSLMLRAVMTGTIIAEMIGLPLVAWKDLHENGGIYLEDQVSGQLVGLPGRNRAFFEQNYPGLHLPEDLGEQGWWNRPFETESERSPRAGRFLAELLQRHGGTEDRIGVVSHASFFNRIVGHILRMSSLEGLWFVMNNCAITRIDFFDDQTRVIYTNRADFLPGDLIT